MTTLRRRAAVLGYVLLALALAWVGGLAWFIRAAERPVPPPPHADGIVALTGGADRVETALRLLAAGRADWLLVSGMGPGADLAPQARRAGVDAALLAPRVELGRQATSTRGNATETAAWAQGRHIHTLIVVTAWYHMPRALTELSRALPDVILYPAPVAPEGSLLPSLTAARLLMEEYTKYLGSRLDLTALLPERAPLPARSPHPG
jgi:uncharacterized SAM-binding protein YcdF (DUF218 family)